MAYEQTHFRARGMNPAVKAAAEAAARAKTLKTGKPYRVEYRDHYNDYSVVGAFVVVEG